MVFCTKAPSWDFYSQGSKWLRENHNALHVTVRIKQAKIFTSGSSVRTLKGIWEEVCEVSFP
jgi:hypothetical protein